MSNVWKCMSLHIKAYVLILMLSFSACNNPKQIKSEQLKNYIEANDLSLSSFNNILVLNEFECPSCNRSFSMLLEKQLNNPKSLLIISAKGSLLDISPFIESSSQQNVIHDFNLKFPELGISKGSSAFFFKPDETIDTIVAIRAKKLESTLDYINNRLEIKSQ